MTEEKEKRPVELSRREFLKDAGLLVGGTAIGSTVLLAACGGGETETVTNTVTRTQTATTTSTLPGETQTVTTTVGAGQTATVTQTQTQTEILTEARFVCPTCGLEFDTLAELQVHFAAEHPAEVLENVIHISVNGRDYGIPVEPQWTLAYLLRDKLGLTGTKLSCDEGACGRCTVIIDGEPILSCMALALEYDGKNVLTIEGLEQNGELDPLQEAFVNNYATQCSFCVPGMIMSAKVLLDENPNPTKDEVKEALSGVLCRCGNYARYIQAVMSV
jgi:carbon-monoxide dehydrogenase small subunit